MVRCRCSAPLRGRAGSATLRLPPLPASLRVNEPERHPPVDQIRSLTAIRGVAAWWVALYHFHLEMPPLGGGFAERLLGQGFLAVDLFFTLSGFVIALNYTGAFATLTARDYGRFLGRRLARIYPLHVVTLLLFLANPLAILLFSHSGAPGQRYDPVYYLLSLLLLQNWGFVNHLAWNIPAWSISAEWGAYLLFPLLARAVWPRLRTPAATIALAAELLAAAAAILKLPDFLLVPAALALLIHGLRRQPRWVEWVLGWRVLELIGTVSYSTYLVHYFVRDWVKFLLVGTGVPAGVALAVYVTATGLASVALYRLVELPGRRLLRAAFAAGEDVPTPAGARPRSAAGVRAGLLRARG